MWGRKNKSEERSKADKDPTSIGNLLIEMGFAKPCEVIAALDVQNGDKLGGLMVNRKVISQEQLEEVILLQKVRRNKASSKELLDSTVMRQRRATKEHNTSVARLQSMLGELPTTR